MPTAGSAFDWSILFLMAAPYTVVGAVGGWLCYQYRRAGRRGSGRVLRVLGRAVRLRCPRCGRTPLYRGAFAMHGRCAACGLRYEREQGYFMGAIYINYAATVVVAAGSVLTADALFGLTLAQQLGLGIALAALVPLAFFRYSRSLWLSVDYLTSADERREHERLRRWPRSQG
jgi:uncharacterized protein (DUF983 family)